MSEFQSLSRWHTLGNGRLHHSLLKLPASTRWLYWQQLGGETKSRKCHVFFYSFWWILNILQTRDASSCKKKNFIEIIFLLKSILVWKVCLKKLPTLKIAFAVSKYKPVLAQPPVKSTPFTRLSFCNATPNKQA